jgi:3-phosphoshikimate 1-carboxyvinyltransferase
MKGDASLSRRPMKRIAKPLNEMGAVVTGETPPLSIQGGQLHGITYHSEVASAQVKSCVLLAGLRADSQTVLHEPTKSRDHTERMLTAMGASITVDGNSVAIEPSFDLKPFEMRVPGDISSAAFWLVAGALLAEQPLTLIGVNVNPTRTGILDVLNQVGASVVHRNPRDENGEPVADLEITRDGTKPFVIEGILVPRLIDEIPVLAVLATQLSGETNIRDARELRVKETDRIGVVSAGLRAMGANIEPTEDGFVIQGPTPLKGAIIDASGDHRIGMAFAIAGLVADGETVIENADSIQTSYPNFESHLRSIVKS